MASIEELLGIKDAGKDADDEEKKDENSNGSSHDSTAVAFSKGISTGVLDNNGADIPHRSDTPANSLSAILAATGIRKKEQAQQLKEQLAAKAAEESIPLQKSSTPNSSPTLKDLSKFVFEEQDDEFDGDVIEEFSSYLQALDSSTGTDIPSNLSKCLLFIKEHAFLADILKPEHGAILVNGLRQSYGFVVQNKTEKSQKKAAANKKVDSILDTMSGLDF